MTAYILRRLLATIPVMVVVAIFVFDLLLLNGRSLLETDG